MRPASAIALLLAALAGGSSGAAETSRPREVAISNSAMIADEDARQRLRYLASCALDADTVLTAGDEGTRYRFPGGMALAPEWAAGAIPAEQRRLVSACILARTNLFGVPVQISMRAEGGPPSLIATEEERRSHPAHEGGFFGDIFAESPTAYVCVEDGHAARRVAQESEQRVCTHPSGNFTADGRPLSRCGFVIVEGCGDGAGVEIDGRLWTEIIHVFLPRH